MEKPISVRPEHIRDEKVKVLESVLPIKDEDIVLGQYEGYRDDPTVPDNSNTPTFASVILRVHNERWEGVPFILKAGKALESRKADIRIQFKDVPGDIFKCQKQGRNEFVIRLQPSEAMYMKLTVKQPGLEMSTVQSELDLSYRQRYNGVTIPEAYERLILDTRSRGILPGSWWSVPSQCLVATGRVGAVQLRFPVATAGISVDRSGADPGSISR
ncbi:glucose-6-phosphate 1-dehydrogenase cytoplasmic-like, partial [Trifolium pratense]